MAPLRRQKDNGHIYCPKVTTLLVMVPCPCMARDIRRHGVARRRSVFTSRIRKWGTQNTVRSTTTTEERGRELSEPDDASLAHLSLSCLLFPFQFLQATRQTPAFLGCLKKTAEMAPKFHAWSQQRVEPTDRLHVVPVCPCPVGPSSIERL